MTYIVITTEQQLQAAKSIRTKVFVEEQGVDEKLEHDQFDVLHSDQCIHLLWYEQEQAAGTGRLLKLSDTKAKLQRICVLPQYRQQSIGKKIVLALEEEAHKQGIKELQLGAQLHAKDFYEKLGYEVCSDLFEEAGIQHVMMNKIIM